MSYLESDCKDQVLPVQNQRSKKSYTIFFSVAILPPHRALRTRVVRAVVRVPEVGVTRFLAAQHIYSIPIFRLLF